MKTTIEIADSLLEWARTEAAERGVTLRAVVEEALRAALEAKQAAGRRPFKLGKSHFEGRGLQPGVTLGDWELVRSLIYEARRVIAVDTNILVYAHRLDAEWHSAADACLTQLAESGSPWAIPWPCIHEFLAVVTHPRIFDPPTPVAIALDEIEHWLGCPNLAVIGEVAGYWRHFRNLVTEGKVAGPKVHDGRIAALCQLHGVTELWSADRDFSRFPAVRVRNPMRSA